MRGAGCLIGSLFALLAGAVVPAAAVPPAASPAQAAHSAPAVAAAPATAPGAKKVKSKKLIQPVSAAASSQIGAPPHEADARAYVKHGRIHVSLVAQLSPYATRASKTRRPDKVDARFELLAAAGTAGDTVVGPTLTATLSRGTRTYHRKGKYTERLSVSREGLLRAEIVLPRKVSKEVLAQVRAAGPTVLADRIVLRVTHRKSVAPKAHNSSPGGYDVLQPMTVRVRTDKAPAHISEVTAQSRNYLQVVTFQNNTATDMNPDGSPVMLTAYPISCMYDTRYNNGTLKHPSDANLGTLNGMTLSPGQSVSVTIRSDADTSDGPQDSSDSVSYAMHDFDTALARALDGRRTSPQWQLDPVVTGSITDPNSEIMSKTLTFEYTIADAMWQLNTDGTQTLAGGLWNAARRMFGLSTVDAAAEIAIYPLMDVVSSVAGPVMGVAWGLKQLVKGSCKDQQSTFVTGAYDLDQPWVHYRQAYDMNPVGDAMPMTASHPGTGQPVRADANGMFTNSAATIFNNATQLMQVAPWEPTGVPGSASASGLDAVWILQEPMGYREGRGPAPQPNLSVVAQPDGSAIATCPIPNDRLRMPGTATAVASAGSINDDDFRSMGTPAGDGPYDPTEPGRALDGTTGHPTAANQAPTLAHSLIYANQQQVAFWYSPDGNKWTTAVATNNDNPSVAVPAGNKYVKCTVQDLGLTAPLPNVGAVAPNEFPHHSGPKYSTSHLFGIMAPSNVWAQDAAGRWAGPAVDTDVPFYSSVLRPGQVLRAAKGDMLANGEAATIRIKFENQGNLVAYMGTMKIWETATANRGGEAATAQMENSALVLRNGAGNEYWASPSLPGILPNANLSILPSGAIAFCQNGTMACVNIANGGGMGTTLPTGGAISNSTYPGPYQFLLSANGNAALVFQPDGNLVLYRGRKALWNTTPFSALANGNGVAFMQGDCNFVVYDRALFVAGDQRAAKWWTGSNGRSSNCTLVVNDGHFPGPIGQIYAGTNWMVLGGDGHPVFWSNV